VTQQLSTSRYWQRLWHNSYQHIGINNACERIKPWSINIQNRTNSFQTRNKTKIYIVIVFSSLLAPVLSHRLMCWMSERRNKDKCNGGFIIKQHLEKQLPICEHVRCSLESVENPWPLRSVYICTLIGSWTYDVHLRLLVSPSRELKRQSVIIKHMYPVRTLYLLRSGVVALWITRSIEALPYAKGCLLFVGWAIRPECVVLSYVRKW